MTLGARRTRYTYEDYAEVATFTDNDVLTSNAFPGLRIDLREVF